MSTTEPNGLFPDEAKPTALSVIADNIPDYLKSLNQWVVWRYEKHAKRWTKVPYCVESWFDACFHSDGHKLYRASSTKPATWTTFERALLVYEQGEFDGIGIALAPPLVGVDVDKCRGTDRERIFIDSFNSYSELSPSGKGVRIFCTGSLPDKGFKNATCEIYQRGRYLTVTGHHIEGTPNTVEERQRVILGCVKKLFAADETTKETPKVPTVTLTLDDERILELCRSAKNSEKFAALWSGEDDRLLSAGVPLKPDEATPDSSVADYKLCHMLAFYTSDFDQIDRLVSQSGLNRDKWDRHDYKTRTINGALRNVSEKYSGEDNSKLRELEAEAESVVSNADDIPITSETEKWANLAVEKAKETVSHRRRGYKPSELRTLPPLAWQIKGHVPVNSFGMIYGASGIGKSFVALDMALCVATGKPFLGIYEVQQGPVVYIYSEGIPGARQRYLAWAQHYERETEEVLFVPSTFDLLDGDEAKEVLKIAQDDLGAVPSLIVVDTLARNFGAGNERTSDDMNKYVTNLDHLRKATKGTVLSIHHTGWEGSRSRGATNLPGACDVMIQLSGQSNANTVTVKCDKQKDAEPFEPYKLTKQVVRTDNGSSLVWTRQDQWATRYELLDKKDRDVLDTIFTKFGEGEFEANDVYSLCDSKRTAQRLLARLKDSELLLKSGRGSYSVNSQAHSVLVSGR